MAASAAAAAVLPLGFKQTQSSTLNRRIRFCPAVKCQSTSSSNPHQSWEREEARWLREEQRWIREEQRWLREEARWSTERESLLREIASLRVTVEALERERETQVSPLLTPNSGDSKLQALEALLQILREKQKRQPPSPPAALVEEAQVKEMILDETRVSERDDARIGVEDKKVEEKRSKETVRDRRPLRKGSEGEDVRAMQEALEKLGFYSGEEDMEYSMFSTGTERAVKTWQASLGVTEDGVLTSELLTVLFTGSDRGKDSLKDGANGAPVASVKELAEIQQTIVKDNGFKEVEVSQHRVFLLGENRWEEPSRLVGKNKPISQSKSTSKVKCLSCHGEGRLMCTECDGTGEPNIEPQFLEWVDEGTKCPYCAGLGYTICDVCEGKTAVQSH